MTTHSFDSKTLEAAKATFRSTKKLGDRALAQLPDSGVHWSPDPESNSIAVIVQHLHGNMLSRWTDFLTTDGEKPWRDRDNEFVETSRVDHVDLLRLWEEGWACVFGALDSLHPTDLLATITIRGEAHTVLDAINRQLSHYSYHVGQIVYVARATRGASWTSLSIPRGESRNYRPA